MVRMANFTFYIQHILFTLPQQIFFIKKNQLAYLRGEVAIPVEY